MRVELEAPAKINLFLRVLERRPDRYHRIESVMIKLALADTLSVEVEKGDEISVAVPGFPKLENEKNLGFKAAKNYLARAGIRGKISIRIEKRIPIAGGLGGGSSDAAAVLRALDRMLGLLPPADLFSIALKLGADVPFFLKNVPVALALGIGEELTAWPILPPRPIVLVNPAVEVPTKDVYEALGRLPEWIDAACPDYSKPPKNWNEFEAFWSLSNDLEEPAQRLFPVIGEISQALREGGAEKVRMSGSGGSVFGVFGSSESAQAAAQPIALRWSSWATSTREG